MNYYFKKWIEKMYLSIPGNLAIYDQLTGLYNFNWFEKIAKSKYFNKDTYITMIDLNNFKAINDTKGHEYANEVLKDVAQQLCRVKELDPEADVMRYGGDEFVIFSNIDFGAKIAEEPDNKMKPLVSYGTYHKDNYEGLTTAMSAADEIMYTFKKSYKESLEAEKISTDIYNIDLDKWQQIYHIIYDLIFNEDNKEKILGMYNFNCIRRYIIDQLSLEQYKIKDKYITEINKMHGLYDKNYCEGNPANTIHKFRSSVANAMIENLNKENKI